MDRVGADVLRRDVAQRTRGVFHFTGDRAQSLSTRGSPKTMQTTTHRIHLTMRRSLMLEDEDPPRRPTACDLPENTSVMGLMEPVPLRGACSRRPSRRGVVEPVQKNARVYHHGDTLSIGAATRQRHSRRARVAIIVAARSCSRERPTSSGNARPFASAAAIAVNKRRRHHVPSPASAAPSSSDPATTAPLGIPSNPATDRSPGTSIPLAARRG